MEARPLVELLREAIAASGFRLRGPRDPDKKPEHAPQPGPDKSVTITISIGIAENSKKLSTPELVLESRRRGTLPRQRVWRNCVRLAEGIPA